MVAALVVPALSVRVSPQVAIVPASSIRSTPAAPTRRTGRGTIGHGRGTAAARAASAAPTSEREVRVTVVNDTLDAAEPFGHVILRLNRELIHHGSEIMTLQDLHALAA